MTLHVVKKRFVLFLPIYLSFFVVLGVYEIIHPPFSTDSAKIGNYEIKIETTPSVPEVGKDTKIHFLVLDKNERPVDKFRMGIQIYHNEDIVKTFPPADYFSGRSDLNYLFNESGNHIIRADLFDLNTGDVLSYVFNVGVLNLYMNIFLYLVIAGLAGASSIPITLIIFQKIKKKNET